MSPEEFFDLFDKLPRVRREFINTYGWGAFTHWRSLVQKGISMRAFETALCKEMNLPTTNLVVDQYERGDFK